MIRIKMFERKNKAQLKQLIERQANSLFHQHGGFSHWENFWTLTATPPMGGESLNPLPCKWKNRW
ncbi:hypothetical protein C4553_03490 [Candidatus Parcubacteria bacterium]|nr:MAG: hypothetical protein C4553_03490 [Candidatus Parcubacteria bacterium]